MTEVIPPEKVDPETLVLRAKPRRVIRIKRNLLIAISAVGCLALVGLVWLGLGPYLIHPVAPAVSDKDPEKHKAGVPEQVTALPKTYADVPLLGQPLPGDLGGPIMEHQKKHGTMALAETGSGSGQRAGRSSGEEARTSGLFFSTANQSGTAVPAAAGGGADHGLEGLNQSLMALPMGATVPAPQLTGQAAKVSFLETVKRDGSVNPHSVQAPASRNIVMAGTVISASLITGLNSDLPGTVLAQVTADVHDSLTGRITLIPQGARLIGKFDSQLSFGQSRILVVWQRLIFPDGRSLEVDNLPASDTEGFSGLADRVNYHTAALLKGIGLSTLLGISGELGRNTDDDFVAALRRSVQETANSTGQNIVSREIDVQPTVTIRPGMPLRVIVQKDLVLDGLAGGGTP